jgi:hypothetical protein
MIWDDPDELDGQRRGKGVSCRTDQLGCIRIKEKVMKIADLYV